MGQTFITNEDGSFDREVNVAQYENDLKEFTKAILNGIMSSVHSRDPEWDKVSKNAPGVAIEIAKATLAELEREINSK